MKRNEGRFGSGIVVGLVLLMAMFSTSVIPAPAEAAIVPQWTQATPLNDTRSEAVVVQDDAGLVYIVGGMLTVAYDDVNNVSSYDPNTGQWRDLAPLPQSTRGAAGAYSDGKIYVFGGYAGAIGWLDNTQIYDVASNTWSSGTALPQRLWQAKAGAGGDGLIYVFGGKTPAYTYSDVVNIYDPATNGWTFGTNMPVGTSGGAVVAVGSSFYYIGGTTSIGVTDDVNLYYTWGGWYARSPLPRATQTLGAAMGVDGLVYAFGGSDTESEIGFGFNWTYYYDVWANAWHNGPNMSYYPRYVSGLATSDGRILAIGGAIDGAVVSAVFSMRIMSISVSVAPTIVPAGRPVMVTVSADFANVVPSNFEGEAALVSGSGTTYSSVQFQVPDGGTFAFQMEVPEGLSAGAYEVFIPSIFVGFAVGAVTLPEQRVPLTVVVGETLDQQMESLMDEIADLQAQLANSQENVTALVAQMTVLLTALTELQNQVRDIQDQEDRLETKANNAGTYGMVNIVLVIVIIVLLALMFMMSRKKP